MSQAESYLADEYEESKAEVLRTVAAKLGADRLAGVDLDAAYNEAWHALYLRLEGEEEVENRKGFLVTVTYRRALSERRAVRLERVTDAVDLAEVGVELDVDARLDAEMQLRHLMQGLRAQLDDRELQAATLTHLHGLTRPEAAAVIGIAPKRMEKLMDRAAKRINAVIEAVRPGALCDEFDSLVRGFAVGLLDEEGERYAIARDHLETCPACRRKVLLLRGLGAIVPPVPATLTMLAGAAGVGAAHAGVGAGKGAATKGILAKLGGKAAATSSKAALIGGAATAATATVAAVAVVAVSGGGHHGPPNGGGRPTPALGAAVAGTEGAGSPAPVAPRQTKKSVDKAAKKQKKKKPKKHAAKHQKRQRHKAQASATLPSASEVEAVAAEPGYEPAPEPTYEPPVEAAPEPAPQTAAAPPEPSAPTESQQPTTNASVEFELR